jgi:anti-sigma B factor antagonist
MEQQLRRKSRFSQELAFDGNNPRATVADAVSVNSMAMMLQTEVFEFEPDITGISCSGRFTMGTRLSETEAMIHSLIAGGMRKLALDLTHVDVVDSAGLGVIMRIFGELNERGGSLRISGPPEQVKRLFAITHTSTILVVDPDLVTSVKKLQENTAAATA